MGTQAQKATAAHARAARWPSVNLNYELSDNEQASLIVAAQLHSPACVDSDSDDDCGYTGGINVCVDSEWQEEEMDGRDHDEWLDTESLAELEGEELDACCNKCILKWQPDFAKQKSLVQETIEAASHVSFLTEISL